MSLKLVYRMMENETGDKRSGEEPGVEGEEAKKPTDELGVSKCVEKEGAKWNRWTRSSQL